MNDEERIQKEHRKQGIAGVFSRSAATYDHVGPPFFAHFGRRLVELAQIPAGARVLDVAAGRGAVLFPAAEQVGPHGYVIGIDLAEDMVKTTSEEIKQRGIRNAEMRRMDAEQLEFSDASFDCVLCGYALFFFPNLNRALSEFRRVLKPGGKLAVSTWGRDDERWKWLGQLLDAHRPPDTPQPPSGPNRFNNQAGLEEIMRENQFENIQVFDEEAEFFYADEEQWWATQWSHGGRYPLEMMSPDVQEKFKSAAFEKLQALRQPNGIPHNLPSLITVATRPR
jgi:ubiquinone/menaquinone biosynthesis C-methylase UbiE